MPTHAAENPDGDIGSSSARTCAWEGCSRHSQPRVLMMAVVPTTGRGIVNDAPEERATARWQPTREQVAIDCQPESNYPPNTATLRPSTNPRHAQNRPASSNQTSRTN